MSVFAPGHPMRAISVYLALTTALSSVFWALMIASGHVLAAHGAYAVGLEWCPGSAAFLTCDILRIDLAPLAWHWRPWRWQILAYVTPLAVCAMAYGVVWTTGLGGFPNMKTVAALRDSLGLAGLTTPEVILLWVGLWLTAGGGGGLPPPLGGGGGWGGVFSPPPSGALGFFKGPAVTPATLAGVGFLLLVFL